MLSVILEKFLEKIKTIIPKCFQKNLSMLLKKKEFKFITDDVYIIFYLSILD